VAVTEQDGDGILSRMGKVALIRDDDEIRVAVVVEVIDGNLPGFWRLPGTVNQRRSAGRHGHRQEDGYGVVVEIGSDDVWVAVVVEVGSAESFVGTVACGEVFARRKEAPRAVPAENFNLIVPPAVCGGAEFLIGVKVSDDNAMRMRVRVDVDGRPGRKMKASMSVAEKDAQIGRLVVGNDEI